MRMSGIRLPSTAGPWAIAGAALGVGTGLFFTMILTGEILSDPGGWQGVGLAAAVGVPIVVLGATVLVRPRVGASVLTVLSTLYVAVSWAALVAAEWVVEFEDSHGPVLLALGLVLWIPTAVLGLFRPLHAGALLVSMVLLPALADLVAVLVFERPALVVSFVTLGVPFVIAGVLMLIDALTSRRRRPADGTKQSHAAQSGAAQSGTESIG